MEPKHNEIDWERLDRYVRKLGTFEELAELERWVNSDPALKQLAETMRTVGRRPDAGGSSWDARSAWAEMKQRIRETPVRVLRVAKSSGEWRAAGQLTTSIWHSASTNWVRAAAVFVFVVGSATLAVWLKARSPAADAVTSAAPRVVATARGERREIRFDDGTVITLGAESEIRYAFDARQRNVALKGLANFRVPHDSSRPFTVQAGNSRITDLGTVFIVRAYPGDPRVEVAVRSGRVSLHAQADSGRRIELRRGDAATLDSAGATEVRHGANIARYTAWMSGRLSFEDQSLRDVAAELARWFDVEVRFADSAVARRRVTAVYSDPALSGVLDALSATLGVSYERSGRTVTFSSKVR